MKILFYLAKKGEKDIKLKAIEHPKPDKYTTASMAFDFMARRKLVVRNVIFVSFPLLTRVILVH